MGDLTRNLSRHEFACGCGCDDYPAVDYWLVYAVQDSVDYFCVKLGVDKLILDVHSGYRCKIHNAYIWGKRNEALKAKGIPEQKPAFKSKHIEKKAIDYSIRGVPAKELYDYLCWKHPKNMGIGLYTNRVHLDSRQGKARWESKV